MWSGPAPLKGNQQRWHYHFAHVAMRAFAFAEPEITAASLRSPESAQDLIRAVLSEVAEFYNLDDQQVLALMRAFKVTGRADGERQIYVIAMPPPQGPADCYFLGIMPIKDAGMKYFTLERSVFDGTMLCGWNATGTHLNYGAGPKPEVDAFVAAIIGLRHA
jgi:hypothetical protein